MFAVYMSVPFGGAPRAQAQVPTIILWMTSRSDLHNYIRLSIVSCMYTNHEQLPFKAEECTMRLVHCRQEHILHPIDTT